MAAITNRGPSQWQAKIRKAGFPPISETFALKADTEKWARMVEADMDRGRYLPNKVAEETTINELAQRFETDFAPHHYRSMAWKYKLASIRSKLGRYAIATLTPRLVAEYRDARLDEPDSRYKHDKENAPRVSTATVKGELDLLSKLLGFAAKELGINLPNGNPVLGVRKPKGSRGRDRRLTTTERVALLDACDASGNKWLKPAVQIALETAMRQGEILSLRWEHLDFESRVALLPMTKNGEARAVPLNMEAIETLKRLARSSDGPVLPAPRMTLHKAFSRAVSRAGIKNLTFHDLRHEAMSTLAELGVLNVLELAAVSGHKSLQVLKRYTHLEAGNLAKKIDSAKPANNVRNNG
ncbi:MAG: hypothetical protein C0607_09845 [Azoarcus sp.]|nr:MAG: hypothetical protein C0607_09845 [Azoarcus sp.]